VSTIGPDEIETKLDCSVNGWRSGSRVVRFYVRKGDFLALGGFQKNKKLVFFVR